MLELDVRVLPSLQKHNTVRRRLEELHSGQTLRILNDHDPRPLRYELDDTYPGAFTWTYVESGPQLWRVDILKKTEFACAPQIDMLADCHALQVGEIRLPSGATRSFNSFSQTVALVFHRGEGTINIAGCSRAVQSGTVELISPGERCTIEAAADLHAFVVVAKDQRSAR